MILIFSLNFSCISSGNKFNDDFHSMYMYTIVHLSLFATHAAIKLSVSLLIKFKFEHIVSVSKVIHRIGKKLSENVPS